MKYRLIKFHGGPRDGQLWPREISEGTPPRICYDGHCYDYRYANTVERTYHYTYHSEKNSPQTSQH